MINEIITTNLNDFINSLPKNKWVSLNKVPYQIFYSFFNQYIETRKAILHNTEHTFIIL